MYLIADKYFVKGLKDAARAKFEKSMACAFGGKEFYDVVESIFTATSDTDSGIRDLIAKRVVEERDKYGLKYNRDLDEALRSIPGLAYWVIAYEERLRQDAKAH